jgi:hypothetical protein
VTEDERGPWWANHPEPIEIRRGALEEFDRDLDQHQPGPQTRPIARYEHAVRPGARGARSARWSKCQSAPRC